MSKVKKKAPVATVKTASAVQTATKVAPPVHHHRPAHKLERPVYYVFGRNNYLIMAAGVALLLLGYGLMWGGGTDPKHPEIFDAAAKYSFVRITLCPILIILGLLFQVAAIMYKDKIPAAESNQKSASPSIEQ